MRGHVERRTSDLTGKVTYRPRVYVGKREAAGTSVRSGWHSGRPCPRLRAGEPNAEAELERLRERLERELAGLPEPAPALTVAAMAEAYKAEHLPQLRPLSRANYARIIDRFILPAFGARIAADLTPGDVSEWLARLLREGRLDGRGGMAPKYVRQCRFVFGALYQHAVDLERLDRNLVSAVRGPAVPRREFEPPGVAEIRAALTALAGTRYYVPAAIAAGTGMRRGEVLGLAWSHVDLPGRTVSVRRQLTEVDGVPTFARLKTEAARRDLELPEFVCEALQAEWLRQHERAAMMGHEWTGEALVCPNHDGLPIQPDKFSRGFTAALARRGLPAFRFHDLRHAVATDLLFSGVRADAVQRQLGHTSVSITLGVYAHARPSDRRVIASAIDGFWSPPEPDEANRAQTAPK